MPSRKNPSVASSTFGVETAVSGTSGANGTPAASTSDWYGPSVTTSGAQPASRIAEASGRKGCTSPRVPSVRISGRRGGPAAAARVRFPGRRSGVRSVGEARLRPSTDGFSIGSVGASVGDARLREAWPWAWPLAWPLGSAAGASGGPSGRKVPERSYCIARIAGSIDAIRSRSADASRRHSRAYLALTSFVTLPSGTAQLGSPSAA